MCTIMGSTKAAVLPDPVLAMPYKEDRTIALHTGMSGIGLASEHLYAKEGMHAMSCCEVITILVLAVHVMQQTNVGDMGIITVVS
jgi:hypothetical protein